MIASLRTEISPGNPCSTMQKRFPFNNGVRKCISSEQNYFEKQVELEYVLDEVSFESDFVFVTKHPSGSSVDMLCAQIEDEYVCVAQMTIAGHFLFLLRSPTSLNRNSSYLAAKCISKFVAPYG